MMLFIIIALLIFFSFMGCTRDNKDYDFSHNIIFADSCTKQICLIWDIDKNGELSSQELSLVSPTDLKYAFQGKLISSFDELIFFSGLNYIPSYCFFYNTKLKSITIPSSVQRLGTCCFSGCVNLSSIKIPSSVTTIEMYCFNGCTELVSINLPNSITTLGSGSFYGCKNLESIIIPNSITSIDGCFRGCYSLKKVILPSSLTTIGMYSFSQCSSLESITIPESVISIEQYSFDECNSLKRVNFSSSNPFELDFESIFPSVDTICVPKGAKELYINSWNIRDDIIIIESDPLI